MNGSEALSLLKEYTKNEALLKHMYAVEAAMRAYAKKFSSGIYFYRIVVEGMDDDGAITNTYQTVKKMMLVK